MDAIYTAPALIGGLAVSVLATDWPAPSTHPTGRDETTTS
jgi:hypothetical protein